MVTVPALCSSSSSRGHRCVHPLQLQQRTLHCFRVQACQGCSLCELRGAVLPTLASSRSHCSTAPSLPTLCLHLHLLLLLPGLTLLLAPGLGGAPRVGGPHLVPRTPAEQQRQRQRQHTRNHTHHRP